jgi:Twin arginine targeting (Tat) protein translocase TatC
MPDKDESLTSHLSALRKMLIRCFICAGIFLIPCFIFSPAALDFFLKIILANSNLSLNYFAPMEIFILQIKIAVFMCLILSFPYIAKNFWDFILPALYDKERNFIKPLILSSTLLFCGGVTFCFFLILPFIIKFGMSFSSPNMNPLFGVSNIITLSLTLSAVFGIMFQFPLITFSLIKSGLISYESVKSKRSFVIVGILIIAAILTPPDVVSQIMLALPTYLLFELGLFFARGIKKKKSAEEEEKNTPE